jgi:hypothetical protein
MHIHQSIPHGLLYSVDPQTLAHMHLSGNVADEFDWEEYESDYAEEPLSKSLATFLKDFAGE